MRGVVFLIGAVAVVAPAARAQYPVGSYGLWPSTMAISTSTTECLPTSGGQTLLADKGVVGILLSTVWADVEAADQALDWSDTEHRLREAQVCGITVALSVGISLRHTPGWLSVDSSGTGYSDYGVQLVDLPSFGVIPVFWDPVLTSYRGRFITAAAAFLYSLPPAVSSNVVAVLAQPLGATTNDWSVPHTNPQITAWLAAGYRDGTPDGQPSVKMLAAAKTILDQAAAAFPDKRLKLPFQVTAEALDGTKIGLARAVLDYAYSAYAGRFFAQVNILKSSSVPSCDSPCDLDNVGDNNNPLSLFRLLRDYRAAGFSLGVQMAAAVVNGAVDDCRQNGGHPCHPCDQPPLEYADVLQASSGVGLSYRPTFLEYWNGDARTQTGRGNPCPITPDGREGMRQVFRDTTVSMGGTPRP